VCSSKYKVQSDDLGQVPKYSSVPNLLGLAAVWPDHIEKFSLEVWQLWYFVDQVGHRRER